ncbi:MAG TPA: hypothetical protein VIG99_05605 [Myxococcaceae bacterium]|jgi:hypothetical protein
MPYVFTTFTLPCGTIALRADGSGTITGEDAGILMKRIGPGGANSGMPFLVLTQQMTKVSPEARQLFSHPTGPGVPQAWCALVITSPLIRVTLNFLTRVSRSATGSFKSFAAEPDAIRWLDERVRQDGPTMPAKP